MTKILNLQHRYLNFVDLMTICCIFQPRGCNLDMCGRHLYRRLNKMESDNIQAIT